MYSKIGSLQPNYGNDVYISALFVRYKFIEIQSNLYLFLLCRLGEVCSHVGALLFKIEMGVKMGLTLSSSTSKACQWNSTFRKEVIPATVTEICDKIKGKRTKEVVSIQADGSSFLPQPEVLDELYALVPNAAFFTSVTAPSQIVESQPVATYTEKYPKLLQSLQDPDISDINIDCHCKDIFSGYLCSDYQATN
ncbi:unnamed protein product [Mytilus edulis]|uniref:Uncharacterized protein n=1 Tax=Mytilus edulis TaxID=6550 RepID=A0A8S3S7Z8_MYTED|nr:unnamed protein product [Mytilus edulis]